MQLAATIFYDDTANGRRSTRRPIARASTLRDDAMQPADVVVADLSATGCSFAAAVPLAVGETVRIGLPGVGTQEAEIVRPVDGGFAARFHAPLSDDALDRAFRGESVVRHPAEPMPHPEPAEPDVARWPLAARVAIIAGGSLAGWAGIFALGYLIFA